MELGIFILAGFFALCALLGLSNLSEACDYHRWRDCKSTAGWVFMLLLWFSLRLFAVAFFATPLVALYLIFTH